MQFWDFLDHPPPHYYFLVGLVCLFGPSSGVCPPPPPCHAMSLFYWPPPLPPQQWHNLLINTFMDDNGSHHRFASQIVNLVTIFYKVNNVNNKTKKQLLNMWKYIFFIANHLINPQDTMVPPVRATPIQCVNPEGCVIYYKLQILRYIRKNIYNLKKKKKYYEYKFKNFQLHLLTIKITTKTLLQCLLNH